MRRVGEVEAKVRVRTGAPQGSLSVLSPTCNSLSGSVSPHFLSCLQLCCPAHFELSKRSFVRLNVNSVRNVHAILFPGRSPSPNKVLCHQRQGSHVCTQLVQLGLRQSLKTQTNKTSGCDSHAAAGSGCGSHRPALTQGGHVLPGAADLQVGEQPWTLATSC